jgi:hypothetical protein
MSEVGSTDPLQPIWHILLGGLCRVLGPYITTQLPAKRVTRYVKL